LKCIPGNQNGGARYRSRLVFMFKVREISMITSVLVGFATRYGSTKEIAGEVASTLLESGLAVKLLPLKEIHSLDGYHAVVIGAPLQMFRWHKDAVNFIAKQRRTLVQIPAAVFAVGPVQSPRVEQEWIDARAQIEKELARFPWFKPISVEVLGGVFDPNQLTGLMKTFARSAPASTARDTEQVKAWARGLVEKFNQPG